MPVKTYGSQGQQRSVIIALKLAESELIARLTGEKPVILLDDVMSELDPSRQNFILNHLGDQQVFITCCDPINTLRLKAGKIFQIHAGKLQEERQAGEACTCT
jgi:DNA replication and repair protein RecF